MPQGQAVCGACLRQPPPYSRAIAAFDYGHPWHSLILRFKFHAALDLSRALADRMLAAHQSAGMTAPPDWLLPIPLSKTRLHERGYNQAWALCKPLSRSLGCRSDFELLLRTRDTPHQMALPPDQRADNVRGAFAVEPLRRAELSGACVTLVDDVMTTGATMTEAARTLLQAGAREVSVWVAARTPRPDERHS